MCLPMLLLGTSQHLSKQKREKCLVCFNQGSTELRTFPLAPQAVQSFYLSSEISQHLLNGLAQNYVRTLIVPTQCTLMTAITWFFSQVPPAHYLCDSGWNADISIPGQIVINALNCRQVNGNGSHSFNFLSRSFNQKLINSLASTCKT